MRQSPSDPEPARQANALPVGTSHPPLAYGHAAPTSTGPWWFALVVLIAGAASFCTVWALFQYRARRAPPASRLILPLSTAPALPSPSDPVAFALPYDPGPGRSDAARCTRNLEHVAAALQAWANRHQWRYPDELNDLTRAGLLDPQELICPAAADDLPAAEAVAPSDAGPPTQSGVLRPGYIYLGKGLATPADANTVVLYEPPRHFGGVALNVLFGDGSVRLLSGDDARRLIAHTATGRHPLEYPFKPSPAAHPTTSQAGD